MPLRQFYCYFLLQCGRIQFPKLTDNIMKDIALYETLLGLKSPWSVKTVDFSLKEPRV
jgi:hypothetical protein